MYPIQAAFIFAVAFASVSDQRAITIPSTWHERRSAGMNLLSSDFRRVGNVTSGLRTCCAGPRTYAPPEHIKSQKLRRRELNPGLPRDRRKSSPLYYSGDVNWKLARETLQPPRRATKVLHAGFFSTIITQRQAALSQQGQDGVGQHQDGPTCERKRRVGAIEKAPVWGKQKAVVAAKINDECHGLRNANARIHVTWRM